MTIKETVERLREPTIHGSSAKEVEDIVFRERREVADLLEKLEAALREIDQRLIGAHDGSVILDVQDIARRALSGEK